MRTIRLFRLTTLCMLAHGLTGCGYTILRDLDEEAREAEWAATDSLTTAPDLTISHVEYEFVPPRSRQDPLDQTGYPAMGWFYITVKNLGNASFGKPYLLVCKNLDARAHYPDNLHAMLRNQKGFTIAPDSEEEVRVYFHYPVESSTYRFTIVTNPIIQHSIIEELEAHINRAPIPPLSREFRYDNNEADVSIRGYRDILLDAQQQ